MIKKYILSFILVLFIVITSSYSVNAFLNNSAALNGDNYKKEKVGSCRRNTIVVDGIKRTYYICLPPKYNSKKAYPVLFVFHGGESNAKNILKVTKFRNYQSKYNFILVAPNGLGRFKQEFLLTWNAGHCAGYARDSKVNEINFFNAIIEQIANLYNIDRKRIYLTGISNGAMLTYKIASLLPDIIAGIAPVAGAMNYIPNSHKNPIPVIIFHGTEDKHILYKGGIPLHIFEEKSRVDNSVSSAVNFWVKNNKCSIQPIRNKTKNIIIDKYTNCENNANVILYTIIGAKHAWPGGKKDSLFGDNPSREINASKIILDAFIQDKYF